MNGTQAVQERLSPPLPPPLKRAKRRRPTKGELAAARTIVLAAIAQGHSIAQAAKMAGVIEKTASRFVSKAKGSGEDLSRERLLNLLSVRIEGPDTPIQYVTPMASLYAELQGYKDKSRKEQQLKPLSEVFDAWRAEISSTRAGLAEEIPSKPLGE